MRRATVGKLLGLAGLAGVAATGAVLARDERQRRAYTPEDVRARLHARAELATAAEQPAQEHDDTQAPAALPAGHGDDVRVATRAIPEATTRCGRLAQRARRRLRRLPNHPWRSSPRRG